MHQLKRSCLTLDRDGRGGILISSHIGHDYFNHSSSYLMAVYLWRNIPLRPFSASLVRSYRFFYFSNMSKRSADECGDVKEEGQASNRKIGTVSSLTPESKRQRVAFKHKDDDSSPNPLTFVPQGFNAKRGCLLTDVRIDNVSNLKPYDSSCVLLWMGRDMRTVDNHALTYARALAAHYKVPLKVAFSLPTVPQVSSTGPPPTLRQVGFMLNGLKEVERNLRALHIPFYLLVGPSATRSIPAFVQEHHARAVVCDFFPLRDAMQSVHDVASQMQASNVPMVQIDAHNVVPCFHASPKLEYSARTLRGKLEKVLHEYLVDDFGGPVPPNAEGSLRDCEAVDWDKALAALEIDRTVKPVEGLLAGTAAAWNVLLTFCDTRLTQYAIKRNDPNAKACSDLSPYFHFGHLSPQRAVLYVKSLKRNLNGSTDSFVEETVVRRELSDNFCYYNPNYDNLNGLYPWARETLEQHRDDVRKPSYTRTTLEEARTYDDLWNASQLQLMTTGKMHGFLRMYWAKKILEWSPTAAEALQNALYFNDKYAMDGCDPNGFVGCMWSIGGIHDQGWAERPIFGKIRYMNYEGCKRKFDVAQFVAKYPPAAANAKQARSASSTFFSVKVKDAQKSN